MDEPNAISFQVSRAGQAEVPAGIRPVPLDRFAWFGVVLGTVLVVVGFAGVDAWFYRDVSCVLETKDRAFDHDFYTLTKPFWLTVRGAFASVVGIGVLFGVALLVDANRWRVWTATLLAVALTGLLANFLQGAIGRERPNQGTSHLDFVAPLSQVVTKERVSFPSGEVATAFALATALTFHLPRYRAVWFLAAFLVAGARLVNGAHFVSDVAAGALLGYGCCRALLGVAAGVLPRWAETPVATASDAAPPPTPSESR